MNKFKLYFVLISVALLLFSCTPEDTKTIPLNDYGDQYDADIAMIEEYLKATYFKVIDHPGYEDDQDVIFSDILLDDPDMALIWTSPLLKFKNVELHGITYKVYYIESRIGDLTNGVAPSRVDQVLSSYDGTYLKYVTTTENNTTVTSLDAIPFESVEYPEQWLGLDNTIKGWTEIFPLFNSGTYNTAANPTDPALYNDFGAGVMFLPSGLGYYAAGSFEIPAYSPLVFAFKLFDVKSDDHDGDGILSNDEDINKDGVFDDDTDGDGTYNMYDIDDDGDGALTKNEIKKPAGSPGPSVNYPYKFILIEDDLSTSEDESLMSEPKGIPDINGDGITEPRLRRHLDRNAKPPYTSY